MEVRISKESNKIRIQNDEMIVRVSSKDEAVKHHAPNLKSKFEESVALIRALEKPPRHTKSIKTILPEPQPPNFSSHQVIIQTLLKIVWNCYLAKYRTITTTFQHAIKNKIQTTKRLRDFDSQMNDVETEMFSNLSREIETEMAAKEEAVLTQIRGALRKEGTIDDLFEYAIERGIAATGEDRLFFAPRVDSNLSLVADFDFDTGKLWDEWKLQVERHKLVFQGKLDDLAAIDQKIDGVRKSEKEVESKEADENDGVAMFSQLYRAMVEQLAHVKLEREIKDQSLKRYKIFLHEKLKTAKMRAYGKLRSDITKDEHESIEAATLSLKRDLDKIKLTQDRALAELISLKTNVDQILKSMTITIDLTLESAREYLYNEGLDALLQWQ